jgi:hypothetical protein
MRRHDAIVKRRRALHDELVGPDLLSDDHETGR